MVTFPFELRSRLAYDGKLLSAVVRVVDDSVLGFYRRRMRDQYGIVGKSAAVTWWVPRPSGSRRMPLDTKLGSSSRPSSPSKTADCTSFDCELQF